MHESLQSGVCFVLGTISNTFPSPVFLLQSTGPSLRLSSASQKVTVFRKESRKFLQGQTHCGQKWENENFELIYSRKVLRSPPNAQCWFQSWNPGQNLTFPPPPPPTSYLVLMSKLVCLVCLVFIWGVGKTITNTVICQKNLFFSSL